MKSKCVPTYVTGEALADHLACTPQVIRGYETKGVIKRLKNGKFDQDDCRKRVIAYLRNQAAGRTGAGDDNLATARADLAKEQREAVAFKNAVSRGDYVLVSAVNRELGKVVSISREIILASPGKYAHQCEGLSLPEITKVWAKAAHEVLTELAHAGERL